MPYVVTLSPPHLRYIISIIIQRGDKRTTSAPKEKRRTFKWRQKCGGRVEVRVKAADDLAAVLQLLRQGGRGCGVGVGDQTSGGAPSRCSEYHPVSAGHRRSWRTSRRGYGEKSSREVTVQGQIWVGGEMFVCKIPVCLLLQQKPPLL